MYYDVRRVDAQPYNYGTEKLTVSLELIHFVNNKSFSLV